MRVARISLPVTSPKKTYSFS